MSVQAISWAIALTDLSSSEKLTLICLANYADGDGVCFPGQKKLSEDTCLTDRTVRTALTKLEERGLISRHHRHRNDGTRSSDEYQLHMRKELPVEDGDNRKSFPRQPENISGQYKPNGLSEPSVEPSGRKCVKKRSPRQILETILTADRAEDVIEHRNRLRKPLTARAAEMLANQFDATGNPNAAADLMIERGWQGFNAEWFQNCTKTKQVTHSDYNQYVMKTTDANILPFEQWRKQR